MGPFKCVLLAVLVAASGQTANAQSDGQETERLTLPRFSYPTFFPDDSGRLLYESNTDGSWNIYTLGPGGLTDDGGPVIQLTENSYTDRMPAMSPDGRHVAFVSDRDGEFELYVMPAEGGPAVQLTDNDLPEIHPYWMLDSQRILFNRRTSREPLLYDILSINIEGLDEREILADDELNSYAQMSPDGRYIVFDKWQDNQQDNGEIYVLDVESGALIRLTGNAVYDGYPAWFPDSAHIVFSSQVDGVFKLFRIGVDGSGLTQLTFGPGNDQRANVSADGRRIVFNRTVDDNVNIHILDLE